MKHPRNMNQKELLVFISNITTRDGLLYRGNSHKCIDLPEADWVAHAFGYVCAEQLVEALENEKKSQK